MRRPEKGIRIALIVVALIVFGWLGPALTPTGAPEGGDERRAALSALQDAHAALETPLERILSRAYRIDSLSPLPPGTLDHLGTGPCTHEVVVKVYTAFWLQFATVRVRCGTAGVTRP